MTYLDEICANCAHKRVMHFSNRGRAAHGPGYCLECGKVWQAVEDTEDVDRGLVPLCESFTKIVPVSTWQRISELVFNSGW